MAVEVERIRRLGEQYNSSLKRLAEALDDLAEELKEVIPKALDEFSANGITWDRYGPCSNVGCWGPCFYLGTGWERTLCSGYPNRSGYLHGDFNRRYQTGSPRQYRELARRIPGFLEALVETFQKHDEEQEQLAQRLEAAVTSLRGE